ncbi:HTH-type transcriptional regulator CueR [Thalassocella blandensis]|nr:HTH-type transcriptional regulator CueR [Thalassocella blandensis]
MRTKDIEEKTGLTRDTIRFYEKENLITIPRRADNGYRYYDDKIIRQLKMISRAKALGFTLKEIKELTVLLYSGELTPTKMAGELSKKRDEIDEKLLKLSELKSEIDKALKGLCEYKDELNSP